MARYTGPKDRLSRREGVDLFGKGAKLTRLNVPPGMHGAKRMRAPSQYGRQLREKQKAKRLYGVMEKQFKNYVFKALKTKGDTVSLTSKGMNIPSAKKILGDKNVKIPEWLNRKGAVGLIKRNPTLDDFTEPISIQDIIE